VLVNKSQIKDSRDLEAIARPICDNMTFCRIGVRYSE
jgi:hypothetical protein